MIAVQHFGSISGGKDSQAVLCKMVERIERKGGTWSAEAEAGVLDAVLREIAPWLDAAQRRYANGGASAAPNGSSSHDIGLRARS